METFDNDKLIAIVQNFPALWDKSDRDYAHRGKKENDWRKVMIAIYGNENILKWDRDIQNDIGRDLQKRWKNLRNSFARELAKRKQCKSESGRTWKTYMYFEQMSFLMPSMSYAESNSNFYHLEEDEIKADESIESTDVPLSVLLTIPPNDETNPMCRKRKATDCESNLAAVLAKSLKCIQENEEGSDPDRLFLLSLVQDFKKIPNSRKANVKIAIINAIANGLYMQHPFHPPPIPPCATSTTNTPDNGVYPTLSAVSPIPPHLNSNNLRVTTSLPITQNTSSPYTDCDSQCSRVPNSSVLCKLY